VFILVILVVLVAGTDGQQGAADLQNSSGATISMATVSPPEVCRELAWNQKLQSRLWCL